MSKTILATVLSFLVLATVIGFDINRPHRALTGRDRHRTNVRHTVRVSVALPILEPGPLQQRALIRESRS